MANARSYTIIRAQSTNVLETVIDARLNEGWQLYGNPFTATYSHMPRSDSGFVPSKEDGIVEFCQAMTHELPLEVRQR